MKESTSFAVAQQQAHKVGKSLKNFRTSEGVREARAKMSGPIKEYRKTAGVKRLNRIAASIARNAKRGEDLPKKLIEDATRAGTRFEHISRRRGLNPLEQATKHMTGKQLSNMMKTGAVRRDGRPMGGAVIRLDSFFDEMEKDAGLKTKALKFLAGYLIAKKLFGLGQPKEKKMSKGEMKAMQLGMQMGAQSVVPGARGKIARSMEADITPFESQMSRIEAGLRKHAAFGADLRLNGPGGIKRPPFPTEGSKSLAFKNFKQSRKVGQMAVRPPEPNIRSVTTLPG